MAEAAKLIEFIKKTGAVFKQSSALIHDIPAKVGRSSDFFPAPGRHIN